MIIPDLFLIAVWYFCYRLDAEKYHRTSAVLVYDASAFSMGRYELH